MKSANTSLLSAVIASTCCVVPLLLALAGLGTMGLSAQFAQYDWLFGLIGISLLAFSYRQYFRERTRCASKACEMQGRRFTQFSLGLSTLVILFVVGLMGYSRLAISSGDAVAQPPVPSAAKIADRSEATASLHSLEALAAGAQQVTLKVDGMTCASCAWGVEAALKHAPGVLSAQASLKQNEASVLYKPNETDPQQLAAAVDKLGYKASVMVSESRETGRSADEERKVSNER